MLANWLRAGFASGRVTTSYPKHRPEQIQQHAGWHTLVKVVGTCDRPDCICTDICPTGAIALCMSETTPVVDAGACIGCGHCVAQCPAGVFAWLEDIDLTATSRDGLVTPTGGEIR